MAEGVANVDAHLTNLEAKVALADDLAGLGHRGLPATKICAISFVLTATTGV